MNLDEAQKKIVTSWITEGLRLSDIQKRLGTELGLTLTYMEVRLLVDDLKLVPTDIPRIEKTLPAPPSPAPAASRAAPMPGPLPDLEPEPEPALPGSSKVTVTVDALAQAGAVVSGSVTFSDGQGAMWYMDQLGRMGVAPTTAGYKPSAPDLQAFQVLLEKELVKLGY